MYIISRGFPGDSVVRNLPANAEDMGSIPELGTFPWRRKWQPTLVFLPGKSRGQRSRAAQRPWGHKESDRTQRLSMHSCTQHQKHTAYGDLQVKITIMSKINSFNLFFISSNTFSSSHFLVGINANSFLCFLLVRLPYEI